MTGAKRCAEVGTFLNGKIDRVSVVINEAELSGNLCKGKLTSLDTILKSVQNVLFVKRCTGAIEGFKIAVNGIRCVEQVIGRSVAFMALTFCESMGRGARPSSWKEATMLFFGSRLPSRLQRPAVWSRESSPAASR